MAESQTPAEGGPSADTVADRMDQRGEEANRGSANEQPDPATQDAPPQDNPAGDAARNPD